MKIDFCKMEYTNPCEKEAMIKMFKEHPEYATMSLKQLIKENHRIFDAYDENVDDLKRVADYSVQAYLLGKFIDEYPREDDC